MPVNTGILSRREAQVLQLMAWGHGTNEVGEMLDISPYTVKNHLANAAIKLGTNHQDRVATVMSAVRQGIISISRPSPLGRFWKESK